MRHEEEGHQEDADDEEPAGSPGLLRLDGARRLVLLTAHHKRTSRHHPPILRGGRPVRHRQSATTEGHAAGCRRVGLRPGPVRPTPAAPRA